MDRFPHTPHLAWLGESSLRDDKLLSRSEAELFLSSTVVIEEKVDGANLGLLLDRNGTIQCRNRGGVLHEPYPAQFKMLRAWLDQHEDTLLDVLDESLVLYGEWCAAKHSISYLHLPDWFLAFDVYDREARRFWSTHRRATLTHKAGLRQVPSMGVGNYSLEGLSSLVRQHRTSFGDGPLEGLVVRQEDAEWLIARAKLVRPDFVQQISEHWRSRRIEWNRIDAIPVESRRAG